MMRKCRICGKPANDVVGSYNYTSWMCDEHVDVFDRVEAEPLSRDRRELQRVDLAGEEPPVQRPLGK